MAQKKLSELPISSSLTGNELFLTVQSSISKQINGGAIKNFIAPKIYFNGSLIEAGYTINFSNKFIVTNILNDINVDLPNYEPYITPSIITNEFLAYDKTWKPVTKYTVGLDNVSNNLQLNASDLDTDNTLAANSDSKISSQKAVKAYIDTKAFEGGTF